MVRRARDGGGSIGRLVFDRREAPCRGGRFRVAGLFAGIGGLELGLERAGHTTRLLCELDPYANRVLQSRFPRIELHEDIRDLRVLPRDVDLVAGGFPCQDLSQAGATKGIRGSRSGLVSEVFRLIERSNPRWLLLENVPFMLRLDKGRAMDFLTSKLRSLGFHWAYRVVDTRAFGLPQRRRRVIMLASRTEDPRDILLSEDAGERPESRATKGSAYGFYWTEGVRGLGWAVDSVPTLKGGSSIGIPSPPAIWLRDGRLVTPEIRDAERLQGFPVEWTKPCLGVKGARAGARWKLVGNAVSVPVAKWVGQRLVDPILYSDEGDTPKREGGWPTAAWDLGKGVFTSGVSEWPKRYRWKPLADFLRHEPRPLSRRASLGFYKRARSSSLRFDEGFLDAVAHHVERVSAET